ncbi:MAG: 50S ribosomal protein L25/general stress protein Ctc [Actinomycetaceae bacterium]|nr:50S ribosomal protein L25/general stress protein Ctc [Actinomycetaceae bacterium]MDY6083547.1 50S ribosomal protein L25/general stress protein Ctc [Actinomycetaceae bacterium]
MAANKLQALKRDAFGKGASRQLRRAGRVPGVIYGHGTDPVHFSLDAHDLFIAVRGQANAVVQLDLEGETINALVKDLQRNPLTRVYEHVDLLRVLANEKVEVEVPVEITGTPEPSTVNTIELMHVLVLAPVAEIPEVIYADVTGIQAGEHISVGELKLPEDVEIITDAEEIAVNVNAPEVDYELEAADAAAAEAASAASEE